MLDIYDEKAVAARTNEYALNELVRENNSFILRCASKTCKRFITESDDEYEVALVAFCEAVRAFNADAGGFMGFAALVIRRRLMDYFDKQSRRSNEISAGSAMTWDEDVSTGVIAEVQKALVQKDGTADHTIRDEIEALGDVPMSCRSHCHGGIDGRQRRALDRSQLLTYAEVSLDVNPSIVYSLNKRGRVLNVRAANEDAESVVAELEQDGVRFATLPDAVDRTMALLEDEGFLNEEQADYVLINVSADDVERQNRLSEEVEAAMMETQEQNPTMEYRIDQSDRKTARKAQDEGMSAGRYSAWQQAGDGSDKQDYADKPVRELMGHGQCREVLR